jgi:serine/threonine protein kinase
MFSCKFRSPEEYKYNAETEKVDIYSMGNVFYVLLTELWPFNDDESEDVERLVKAGKRPHIPKRLKESTDPAHEAIRKAIAMCWRQDPEIRATAKEVADFLLDKLKSLNVPSG